MAHSSAPSAPPFMPTCRHQVAAEDTRGALVDTCRRFRAVLDCANSAWADQRWWLAAHTHEETALDSWPGGCRDPGRCCVADYEVLRCVMGVTPPQGLGGSGQLAGWVRGCGPLLCGVNRQAVV